jgi:ATP-dependent protease ClpP protease subunit
MDYKLLNDIAAKVSLPVGTPLASRKGTTGEVYLYQDIGPADMGGIDAKTFVDALAGVKDASTLNVHINSAGGSVFEGVAIYNALHTFKGTVNIFIDGLAASIASVIAMAGTTITMAPEAQMMVHLPYAIAAGNAKNLRAMADLLDRSETSLTSIYCKRTGLATAEVQAMLAAETWLNAKEAVAKGFATAIAGEPTPVAKAPSKIMAAHAATAKVLTDADIAIQVMEMALLKNSV